MKKKVRNKARDVIGDYYKANRQVEKENREAQERQGKTGKWNRTEVVMGLVIALALLGILIRYVILR